MKIGIDVRVLGKKRTGDEAYFFGLVKNLAIADKNNEYYLFTDRDPEKDFDLKKEIKKLELGPNFKIIFIDAPNRFWWNFWALPNYLKKNPACPVRNTQLNSPDAQPEQISDGVDIFHTQYIAPFWMPKNINLVLTIHDISFNFFPQHIKKSDLFFLKTLIPRSLRRADKIIAVSQSEREQIINFYKIPPEKIDFVYNGVDYEKFAKDFSSDEKEKVRKKYNLPEKFLLYIGTLQPRKNIPVLVEAMKSLDIKLVLAGNRNAHNFDKKINKSIKKYNLRDKIIFPGWVDEDDKPILLQLAECFVFPSLYEGFGIPIIEAMAAGVPVACSDIAPLKEIGNGAALFSNPQNSQKLAENIRKILTDENLRNNLIEKGKEVAQKYSWQKTAKKTLGIYESL